MEPARSDRSSKLRAWRAWWRRRTSRKQEQENILLVLFEKKKMRAAWGLTLGDLTMRLFGFLKNEISENTIYMKPDL